MNIHPVIKEVFMRNRRLVQQVLLENSTKSEKPKAVEPKKSKTELLKDIKSVVNKLNKDYGENAVVQGSEFSQNRTVRRIPTGSVELDTRLGGGIPIGRLSLISGAYSSSKTTQALHIVREAQKMGLVCAIFDVEGTIDNKYMQKLGIDTDLVIYVRPKGFEECTQMILDMEKQGIVNLALLDSIAGLEPIKVLNSEMEDSVQMGTKQKLSGEFLAKYQSLNNGLERENKTPFTLIAINQVREKIGAYGDPEFLPGGRAWGFYNSVDLRLRRGDWITEGKGDNKEFVGQVVKFKVEKNKTYKRMQSGEFDFYFANNNAGIEESFNDNFKSIVMLGIEYELIEQGGAWFYLNKGHKNEMKFQGVTKLLDYLRENPHLVEEMKNTILQLDSASK